MRKGQRLVHWGVALLIVLIPWQARFFIHEATLGSHTWEYGTISVYIWDILLVLLLGAAIATKSLRRIQLKNGFLIAALAFIIVSWLSALLADERAAALFGAWLLTKGALLFMLIAGTRMRWGSIALPFVISAGIAAGWGIIQFAQQEIPASTILGVAEHDPGSLGTSVIEAETGRSLRAYGPFPHPNILGGYLAAAWIVSFGLFLQRSYRRHIWRRIVLIISYVLITGGIIITFSRSAWLAMAIGAVCITFVTMWCRRKELLKLLVLGSIALIIIIFTAGIIPELIRERISPTNRLTNFSTEQRTEAMDNAKTIIKKDWMFGVGWQNFTSEAESFTEDTSRIIEPVHSVPYLVFSELGILGFLISFWLLVEFIRVTAVSLKKWGVRTTILTSSAFALLALFVVGLFDHYLASLHSGIILFALVVSLWYASTQRSWLRA